MAMSNSALRKSGSTSQWRKLRAMIIARDHVCQLCGAEENLHVDHIVPRALGGTDEPDNLRVLCRRCNLARNGLKRPMGGFFDSVPTPPTPHRIVRRCRNINLLPIDYAFLPGLS